MSSDEKKPGEAGSAEGRPSPPAKPDVTDEIPTLPKRAAPEVNLDGPTLRRETGKVIVKTQTGATQTGVTEAGAGPVGKTLPSGEEKTKVYDRATRATGTTEKTVVNPRPAKAASPVAAGGPPFFLIAAIVVAAGVAITFVVLSLQERREDAEAEPLRPRSTATVTSSASLPPASATATPTATAVAPTSDVADPSRPTGPGPRPTASGSAAPTSSAPGRPDIPGMPSGLPSWIPTSLPTAIPTSLPTALPSGFPFPPPPPTTKPTATPKPTASAP